MNTQKLKVGDWVQVRSKEEILKTLDENGQLDGMLFMPEMFQYCGQTFQVYKRAHKTCDYTTTYPYRTRRLESAVHLETRCSGEAHDGCEAGCLLNWKQAWLKPITEDQARIIRNTPPAELVNIEPPGAQTKNGGRCSESVVWNRTQTIDPANGTPTYICQATHVQCATKPLAWWDIRQYIEDYSSGNVGLGRIFSALIYSSYYHLSQAGIGVGPAMRWFYNTFRWIWGGSLFPRKPGLIPAGQPTPSVTLNLQPGELVRVKPHEEILKTVDVNNRNRGMFWDAELVPYCGKTYRVHKRVTKLIEERTGKMLNMKSPCIILDSVVCQARYSSCRMLCPKSMYPYWREIWLERVESKQCTASDSEEHSMAAVSSGASRSARTTDKASVNALHGKN